MDSCSFVLADLYQCTRESPTPEIILKETRAMAAARNEKARKRDARSRPLPTEPPVEPAAKEYT